jgi:hypothetical protein
VPTACVHATTSPSSFASARENASLTVATSVAVAGSLTRKFRAATARPSATRIRRACSSMTASGDAPE